MSDVDCGHWAEQETEPVHFAPKAWLPDNIDDLVDDLAVVTDTPNPPYQPVEARTVAYLNQGTPVEAWADVTPADRADHRQACNGCAWCADGRSYGLCKWEGMETEVMEDGNCTCGSPVLLGTDYSDMKANER